MAWPKNIPRIWPIEPTTLYDRYLYAALTSTAILVVLACATAARSPDTRLPRASMPGRLCDRLVSRIDPNTAPWWELAALPRLGEVTARRIVAHRNAWTGGELPFPNAEALDRVHGIGPKTVARMRPYLVFPDPDLPFTHSK